MSLKRAEGFTLIEVAIVIAIIGILVFVAVPQFMSYRTRSPRPIALSSPFVVDGKEQELEVGSVAIGSPLSMQLNDIERAYLLLDLNKEVDKLFVFLPEGHEKHGAKVKVSNRMQASLKSHKFDIKQETPEVQAVGSQKTVKWIWSLKPKEIGEHTLTMMLAALIFVQGQSTPIVLDTYTRKITVSVSVSRNIWTFLQENMSWLWAPISAIGAGILYLTRLIKKKKKARNKKFNKASNKANSVDAHTSRD